VLRGTSFHRWRKVVSWEKGTRERWKGSRMCRLVGLGRLIQRDPMGVDCPDAVARRRVLPASSRGRSPGPDDCRGSVSVFESVDGAG
jgi:hypothetical protein